jgi:hypothetical protein
VLPFSQRLRCLPAAIKIVIVVLIQRYSVFRRSSRAVADWGKRVSWRPNQKTISTVRFDDYLNNIKQKEGNHFIDQRLAVMDSDREENNNDAAVLKQKKMQRLRELEEKKRKTMSAKLGRS